MDSAISTAARALATGEPLVALRFVALRDDAPALALRAIAMAQLGELKPARSLLRRAQKAFGPGENTAVARCTLARAEISLALRDLDDAAVGLDAARRTLIAKGDQANALLAQLLEVRRLMLMGEREAAQALLATASMERMPLRLVAMARLLSAELCARALDDAGARKSLGEARTAAQASRVGALVSEVDHLERKLDAPVARWVASGEERLLALRDFATLPLANLLLVDACRREVRRAMTVVALASRPVLLELAVALALRAPEAAGRDELVLRAFGARRVNESHRARLRVEVGRLRRELAAVAVIRATATGYVLKPRLPDTVAVLLPPQPGESSALMALLRSGESWPTSALATSLGKSQRAVQRALAELESQQLVHSVGKGRSQRWVAVSSPGSATTLLLVAPGTLA